jgi:uncharacterized protein YndB with AHSA1/START domain
MLTYEATRSIAAPRAVVWPVLSDVAAWADWLPTVTKVEPLDGRSLRPGARFVVHQPKLRPTTWIVSELDPPRCFVWVARSPGLRMIAEHALGEDATTASQVTLRFSFAGVLGGIVGRLSRSLTESYIAREAASLQERVESGR